jgi:hypothetical protein
MTSLSIVTLGDVHSEHLAPLSERFERLEQLVLDVNPRDPLSRHRPEFNRAIDAASHDWILIVRERERIDEQLAGEISSAANEARAWGFRIRVVPLYAGKPLRIGDGDGEVRLFHKRHYIRFANKGEWEDVSVQGTIVRLSAVLHSVTFESVAEHRAYRERTSRPQSTIRQAFLFLRNAIGTGTLDRNTLRYLWVEAGFE